VFKDKFLTPTVPLTTVLPNRHVFLPDPVYIYIYIYIFFSLQNLSVDEINVVSMYKSVVNWDGSDGIATSLWAG